MGCLRSCGELVTKSGMDRDSWYPDSRAVICFFVLGEVHLSNTIWEVLRQTNQYCRMMRC